MKLIAGDETGIVKRITMESKIPSIDILNKEVTQSRAIGVEKMCWLQNDGIEPETQMAMGLKNGIVQQYDINENSSAWKFKVMDTLTGLEDIMEDSRIVTCNEKGHVGIRKYDSVQVYDEESFQVKNNVNVMRMEKVDKKCIAVGGNEHDVALWDMEKMVNVFKAKNVPHDKLDMRVPVCIKDLGLFNAGKNIVSGSAYQHLRIYDVKAKRRPMVSIKTEEYPIQCLCISNDKNKVVVADTTGDVHAYDLRTLRMMGRFVGPGGSIRSMVCHSTLPYIAMTGLDRKTYVYDVNTRKHVHTVYLKQRQNALLFTNDEEEGGLFDLHDADEKKPPSKKQKANALLVEDTMESSDEGEEYEGLELQDGTSSDDDEA